MSGPERKCSPFVESRRPLFCHHGPGTVDSALVLAWWGVHVPSFHHIYRGSDHCGNKACAKRRNKVAGQVICGDKKKTQQHKSMNDGDQRAFVLTLTVWKHTCQQIVQHRGRGNIYD